MGKNLKLSLQSIFNESKELSYSFEELVSLTACENPEEMREHLRTFEQDGYLWKRKDLTYVTLETEGLVYGKLQSHPNGFAFLQVANKEGKDIYIAENDLKNSLHGDFVVVKVIGPSTSRRPEGKVIRLAKRGLTRFVGTYFENGNSPYVVPDESRLSIKVMIDKEEKLNAVNGHKVLVQIKETSLSEGFTGEIIEVIGHRNDPGVDILSIVHEHGLSINFSEETMEQITSIPETIDPSDTEHRKDFRDELIITIDGEDAKDLDDAVHVKKLSDGNFELGVHIADVSHYVQEGSPLDLDAYERATSVYLVDRVIPMLPHYLSNGVCSLHPHVDRLTLSCIMTFDSDGILLDSKMYESVIRTTERMTYTDVNSILKTKDASTREKYAHIVPFLETMEDLADKLRTKRYERGSIDFDVKESKVIVDEEGKPLDIFFRERSIAEKMIEDFMLTANETVSEVISRLDLPSIYRIHDIPREEKIRHFFEFITRFGHRFTGHPDHIEPKDLQQFMEKVKGKPEESVVSRLLLRSMSQAKYSFENIGHFGLAAEYYSHFTSPIRRYPDLLLHRLVRTYLLNNQKGEIVKSHYQSLLPILCEHTSQRERRAVEAERDTQQLKKTEFMQDKLGKEFIGMISSVTKFGFFVELENTIEGLVHIDSLEGEKYQFDMKHLSLVGKRSGNRYTIGDSVQVRLVGTDISEHTIDFELVNTIGKTPSKPSKVKRSYQKGTKQMDINHSMGNTRKKRFDHLYKNK